MAVPGFSQVSKLGAAGKALAKQSSRLVPNISSKLVKVRYGLTVQSLQVLQEVHTQRVAGLLTDPSVNMPERMRLLEKYNEESSVALADLTERMNREYAQWSDILLRERNPHFLPKKDPAIPGMLALSPEPTEFPHLSPRLFREWAAVIPAFEEVPEEVNGLVAALRKKLMTMELEVLRESQKYLKARAEIDPMDNFSANRYYRGQMSRASRQLLRLSKESAQCMADLVYVLNLYPTLYKDSLTLLASKLDGGLQTEFTEYLRARIRVPKIQSPAKRRVIGFYQPNEPLPHGTEITAPK